MTNPVGPSSPASRVRILIAEDEPEIRDYLQLALRRPNFQIDFAENGEEVLNCLASAEDTPALVIMDVMMPCRDGISTLREIRKSYPGLPVIMLSGLSSTVNIVEAMKSGASNFLTKPVSHDTLRQAVDQLLPAMPRPQERRSEPQFGAARWDRKLGPVLDRISISNVPVLLQGETGSGKEVLARQIHDRSSRAGQAFLKLNCAALPSELVESELFGYERGAFTGAFKSYPGKFELAHGGTILLDEIGDMDLKLQAKLLQVLQDHEFLRLGAKEPTRVDIRVIAATHRDLEDQIAKGDFREDLYYRLSVINIRIPPLRDRRDEILPLAFFFMKKHSHAELLAPPIGPELESALLAHNWPGNIRELENTVRRYMVLQDSRMIVEELVGRRGLRNLTERQLPTPIQEAADIPRFKRESTPPSEIAEVPASPASPAPVSPPAGSGSALETVDQARKKAEAEVIIQALNSTLWNRRRAAAVLGTDYKALLYKMKKLGIGKAPNSIRMRSRAEAPREIVKQRAGVA